MQLAVALVALAALGGCAPQGATPASVTPSTASPTDASAPSLLDSGTSSPSPSPPANDLPSLETLASRAPALAPGMREAARGDLSGGAAPPLTSPIVRADAVDTCVRVAFVAEPPVHARLIDGHGDVLADAPAASNASFGAHGPVCVRKGDTVTLRVEASGPWAGRFVAWESP